MYKFYDNGHKYRLEGRYWGNNNICITASITRDIDWSAYIGAAPSVQTEDEALNIVADTGTKLSELDARYFFPNIELPYRY